MTTLGAIRYGGFDGRASTLRDSWHAPMMGMPAIRYRKPPYATAPGVSNDPLIYSDNLQNTADMQIEMARRCGIDYFAFDYYPTCPGYPLGGQRTIQLPLMDGFQYYLSSSNRSGVKFCLALIGPFMRLSDPETPPWSQSNWAIIQADIVAKVQHPDYMKVLGGRPLIFLNETPNFIAGYSGGAAFTNIASLKSAILAATGHTPYIATCDGSDTTDGNMTALGLHALSAYHVDATRAAGQYPYSTLTSDAAAYWAAQLATTRNVIPLAQAGWDYSGHNNSEYSARYGALPFVPFGGPAHGYNTPGHRFVRCTPEQLATHVQSALAFCAANPAATPADTVLIYAWDELSEGGWIVPTTDDGGMNLQNIARQLGKQREPVRTLRARGIPFTTR